MADPDERPPKYNSTNEQQTGLDPPEPRVRVRRRASVEALSAIEEVLLPTLARLNVGPLPRREQRPRTIPTPEKPEENVVARPPRPPPEGPIKRSDYRARQIHEPGLLGVIVAVVSMVAILVAFALAYWWLRH